jgi:predicted HTH domain antitoxin
LAIEGYRSGLLGESQVMRLLQLPSRFAVHDWLRERQVPYRYTEADLSDDLADLADLGLR